MDNDDLPIGRLLNRRDAVRLMAGAALFARGGHWYSLDGARELLQPSCVAKPELTEGPYFVDAKLDRSDIRGEPGGGSAVAGAALAVSFAVSRLDRQACAPLADAIVDVWQCDAQGVYSGVRDPQFDTSGKQFLRGFQRTDKGGIARFTTIYPGWYPGRAVHIHFKIRTSAASSAYEFTSQVFFDDAFSDRLFAEDASYRRAGRRDTMNASDGIFRQSRGQLTLPVAKTAAGMTAALNIALDLSDAAVGRADGRGRGRGRP